jgi:peptide deformylase
VELIKYPDPILSQKCADAEMNGETASLLNEMSQKLYEWEGAGLAASQVGILKRVIVIDARETPQRLYKLSNPKIIWKSEKMVESNEGCLSLPLLRDKISRHESVIVEYFDENFEKREIHAAGFLSCCLQHELDHLDGILFINRLSKLKRSRALRKFKELQSGKPMEK